MAFNADESRLFTFCLDWKVRVWRTSDGGLERTFTVPDSLWYLPPLKVPDGFRPDCGALLFGFGETFEDRQLQLFDLASDKLTGKPFAFSRLSGDVNRMRFSPDGSRIASVGHDQSGSIIDFQTGELAAPQFKHGGTLTDLDWSPDGKRLITAGYSSETKLWDATTGEMLLAPMGVGDKPSLAARWSADGRFIVTRNDDNRARVWDASTAEAVTPLLRHSEYIRWACITPGNRLIIASDPNLLRAWDLKPTDLPVDVIADYAKFLSGRRLSASGVLLPVKASELAELSRSLRARAPMLFE
jgi:WD40 repeat protein